MTGESGEVSIRDLCARAGVTRATVHHYAALGLLLPARKTGPRRALYPAANVARIRVIKELQERRFLPLHVVREVVGGGGPAELREVAADLLRRLAAHEGRPWTRREALRRLPIGASVLAELEASGLVRARSDGRFGADDAEILGAVAAMRRAGLDERFGFRPRALALYREACERLLDEEARLFNPRVIGRLPPRRAAALAGVAAVEVSRLLAALHRRLLRQRLEAIVSAPARRPRGKTA